MSTVELIDLNNATPGELRQHLLDQYGIEKAANTGRDKLVAEILAQEQAAGISRDANQAAVEPAKTGAPTRELREIKQADRVKIRISREPNSRGNDDVRAAVNGVAFIIKRETVAEVPRPVYEVLMNARETRYEQREDGSLVPRSVPSYPITLVG